MNHRSNTSTATLRNSLLGEPLTNMRKKDAHSNNPEHSRLMDESNQKDISILADKVSFMNNLALDIERQLKEDDTLINQTSSSFDRVSNMMKSTLGNVNQMLSTGGSRHMCYLILFIVVLFLGLYSLMK